VCICSLRYSACNEHAPYCHLWPAPLYNNFPHYPIKGAIFKKIVIEHKMCFDFLYNFRLKHFLFWEELSEIWQALRLPGGRGSQIQRQLAHEGGKFVRPTHWPPLARSKHSSYSFLLEAVSIPGQERSRKDYTITGNRTRDHPSCSAVPQPTAPPRARGNKQYPSIICVMCLGARLLQFISLCCTDRRECLRTTTLSY
jgi:hypothetical protein